MSTTAQVTEPVEIVVDATPKDAEGKPIGPPQIFKGKTQQEIIDQMATAQQNASRKIVELRTQVKPVYQDDVAEFKPKELSADELFSIQQGFADPTKLRDSFRKLSEAEYGAPPERVRAALADSNFSKEKARVETEAQKFREKHPDYIVCPENWQHISAYFEANKDEQGRAPAPTAHNFELAYEAAKERQLLRLEAPEVKEVKKEEVITSTRPRAASTGLFSQHSSASAPSKSTSDDAFRKEVAAMPSADYRRRIMSDPAFRRKVDGLSNK